MSTKPMTVQQAIEFLSKLSDKTIYVMVDCPFCGKGSQLAEISEAVILKSKESQ